MSTLCKTVCSRAPVKGFCLYGLNNLNVVLFWECHFWKDQRSQLQNYTFSKKNFGVKGLGMCLPYVNRYFQEHQWSAFLFMAQITQILLFSRMLVLQRSKITVWEQKVFKNKFIYGSFWFVSTLRKKVFSGALVKCFFPYSSNNSDSVVWENGGFGDQRSQCESDTFSIIFPPVEFLDRFKP